MSERVPFADLLDRLRHEQAIGVDDYLTLGKFVARARGASMLEIREGLVALFGRDKDGAARVRRVFEELYGALDDPQPSPADAETGVLRGPASGAAPVALHVDRPIVPWWRVRLAVALDWVGARRLLVLFYVAAVAGVCWMSWPREAVDPAEGPSTPVEVPAPPDDGEPRIPPERLAVMLGTPDNPVYGVMPGCATWKAPGIAWWPLLPFTLVFVVGTAITALLAYRRAAPNRRREVQRQRFVARPPGARYERRIGLSPRSFDTAPLKNASSRLERRTEVDVDRTVDETVRRGLLPVIVMRPRRGIARILVLQDIAPSAAAYQPIFDAFVESLERQGMEVARLYFRGSLADVRRTRSATVEPLTQATLHVMERPLVVLSTGEIFPTGAREIAQLLAPWPARVLFTPLSDRGRVPPALLTRTSPLPTFSLDARGIRIAARTIEASLTVLGRSASGQERVLPSQIVRLRAMLALAPTPTYAIAERLRAHFLPDAPRDVLRAMEPIVRAGARSNEAKEALTWFREMDADVLEGEAPGREEAEVWAFLAELLEEARPVLARDPEAATLAELRWRRDRALVTLRSSSEAARVDATRTLDALARGPLRVELEGALELARVPDGPLPELDLVTRLRLALPSFAQMSVVLLVGVLVALGARELVSRRAGPVALDGSARVIVSDEEVVRGLCAFDSFGAGVVDGARTILLGTLEIPAQPQREPYPAIDTYPTKRIVIVEIVEHTLWRTISARLLDTESVYGPEHFGAMVRPEGLAFAVSVRQDDAKPRTLVWTRAVDGDPSAWGAEPSDAVGYYPVSDTPDDAGQRVPGKTFAYYSYATSAYDVGRGAGDRAWAKATHARDATLLTEGLLPGTPQEVLLRLVGQGVRVPLPEVEPPAEASTSSTTGTSTSSSGAASASSGSFERETVDGTMRSFVDCAGKPDVNVRVRGVLAARPLVNGESRGQQAPISNPWSLVGATEASFDLASPPTPRVGQSVSIVFAPRPCPRRTKTIVLEVESWSVVANPNPGAANPPRAPCPPTNVEDCVLVEAPPSLAHCKMICKPAAKAPAAP